MPELRHQVIPRFIRRLKAIGIEIELSGNYPWVYLDTVNGKKVKDRYQANHGFTAFFVAARLDVPTKFSDIKVVFSKIRELVEGDEIVICEPYVNWN